MKKDNTYIYGIIAYVAFVVGTLLSSFSPAVAVVCGVVALVSIIGCMNVEQKRIDSGELKA